jgi:small subunit ribosomal protein S27Ae
MKKTELFKVEGDKVTRLRRHCPKCGAGVFLAEHANRYSCGSCGYTEFKSGGKQESSKPPVKEEKIETPKEQQPSVEEKSKVDEPSVPPAEPSMPSSEVDVKTDEGEVSAEEPAGSSGEKPVEETREGEKSSDEEKTDEGSKSDSDKEEKVE